MGSTVTVGSVIDHYKILEKIGRGGMGVVYKALNVYLDKYVAIKTVTLGLASEENFTNRFRTEARALARLQDPNIVSIYDLRADDDQWYIVMEYVEGMTLAQMIRDYKAIPWQKALSIFKQMLSAIGHAHRAGIIHRDIKPNNVMITATGVVKITDFGLAKDQETKGHTLTATTGGTLHYMSPEQVKGLIFTDYRSDIYSLGLTFYEMLSGKIPFRKDDTDFSIREAIIKRQFPPPTQFNPKIPLGLNAIIMKAIEKDPQDRYQSIPEIFQDIEKFEQEQGLSTKAKMESSHVDKSATSTDISIFPQEIKDISYTVERRKHNYYARDRHIIREKLYAHWKKVLLLLLIPVVILLVFIVYNKNYHQKIFEKLGLQTKAEITISSQPTGMIFLDVQPFDANIKIDGKDIKQADAQNLELSAGFHDIVIGHFNYTTIEDRFEVINGTTQRLTYHLNNTSASLADISTRHTLQPQPSKIFPPSNKKTGRLKIESQPLNTNIWIDNRLIEDQTTPFTLEELPTGKHTIRLTKEGYSEFITQVITHSDEEKEIFAKLEPLLGELNLLVKPWGSIYVDDSLKKKDTNVRHIEQLPAGNHTIKVVHPSFGVWQKSIRIDFNASQKVIVDFNTFIPVAVTAFDTNGEPVWAEIIVDNDATGEITPKEIDIRIGLHTIAVKKEGYILVSGEQQIMLEANLEKPLKFILRKLM